MGKLSLITYFIAYVGLTGTRVFHENPLSMCSAWLEGFQSENDPKIKKKVQPDLRLSFFNQRTVEKRKKTYSGNSVLWNLSWFQTVLHSLTNLTSQTNGIVMGIKTGPTIKSGSEIHVGNLISENSKKPKTKTKTKKTKRKRIEKLTFLMLRSSE